MKIKSVSVVAGLLCVAAGVCSAAQSAGHGVIEFRGSIVEAGCAANARSGAVMELSGCITDSRSSRPEARNMATGGGAARAQLVSQSRDGRYFDQRYLLVDATGKPVESGNYVITLTSP